MNRYLNKLIMYHEIHKMRREGHSISHIATFLGLNWRTVKRLLSMDDREYDVYLLAQSRRSKELAPYESFVRSKLDLFPGTNASQMHDWLKEYDEDFPKVNPKTVYNFVTWVRQEYNITKEKYERDYFIVEELPYGKQAQVDFGEYNMRRSTGGVKKVYFFTLVLSRSRFKYVYFSDTPFTSSLAIRAHEKAFEHIKGIPQEIVYDQDKVFIHDENAGDLLLTSAFKAYVDRQKFKTYFCRKADPETKGKVENVVRYVKHNFLYNRSYFDLETLNDEAFAWLNRTANYLPHGKTKVSPLESWNIEKEHLSAYIPAMIEFDNAKLYTVRKDNAISYKSNLYSVPDGTWAGKGTQVYVTEDNGEIHVKKLSGEALCSCKLCMEKGKTIINNDHKRDKSVKIDQLITNVSERFSTPTYAAQYFETIRSQKPRYIRDQILMIESCFDIYPVGVLDKTLSFCQKQNIYSASDFKSVALKIHHQVNQVIPENSPDIKPLPGLMPNIKKMQPNSSNIIDYESFMSNKN